MSSEERVNESWNNVFEDRTFNWEDNNKKIYEKVREKKEEYWTTLDVCVKYAIKYENHSAFVHFFVESAKNQKTAFYKMLSLFLKEYKKEQEKNKNLPNWEEFELIRQEYWRSIDFICDKDFEQNKKKYIYGSNILYKWKRTDYDSIPYRDVIVQCCIYFGKNAEETNQLLMAAGCSKLYELDIVDLVSIYYLNEYQRNFDIEGLEKLKTIKNIINGMLKELVIENEDMIEVREFAKIRLKQQDLKEEEEKVLQLFKPQWKEDTVILNLSEEIKEETKNKYEIKIQNTYSSRKQKDNEGEYKTISIKNIYGVSNEENEHYLYWQSKEQSLYRFEKKRVLEVAEKEKIGLGIEKKIIEYRRELEKLQENIKIMEPIEKFRGKIGDTDYLTVLYRAKLQKENIVKNYIENGSLPNDIKLVLKQKRYGYLKKTVQYFETYSYYVKNLQDSNCELISSEKFSVDDLIKSRRNFIDKTGKKFCERIQKCEKTQKKEKDSTLYHLVNSIWKLDKIEKGTTKKEHKFIKTSISSKYKDEKDDTKKNIGNFKVKILIEGRRILDGVGYQLENKEENLEEKINAYVVDTIDKFNLIKYAVATGREDEIGIYLQYAGFWQEDLCSMTKLDLEKYFFLDQTDLLILYALKYRDALLEKWAGEQDVTEFINKAKKEFPFIKLLMIINRDIQFVNKNILRQEEKIENLEKLLIYPVTL